jgi:hypothetical protein
MRVGNVDIDPRSFLQLAKAGLGAAALGSAEGGDKAQTNLLRLNSPVALRVRVGGMWRTSGDIGA